jgi:EAL domain-containing protein (putative c-di-GMP-specific phosphodiesterase class I)
MEGPGALRAIMKCRNLGFPVALDDFGTGYSSLSYLAQFEVDTLKIDQSFVRTMLQDNKTSAIVDAVIQMANGLQVPVVAEGIEDAEVCKALTNMKCDYGQGYFFSPPLSMEDAIKFMHQYSSMKFVS